MAASDFWRSLVPVTLLLKLVLCASSSAVSQAPLVQDAPAQPLSDSWDVPPDPDSTGQHIFDATAGLLNHWSNVYYRNGHIVTPAIVSPGTLLFHGRHNASIPTEPEWLSPDRDHSMGFVNDYNESSLLTFMATRELHLLYFDGSSASKMGLGSMDTQDSVLGWDDPSDYHNEPRRIRDLCALVEPYGYDGILRMEFDFEVMYCDFTKGLKLVSSVPIIAGQYDIVIPPFCLPTVEPNGTTPTRHSSRALPITFGPIGGPLICLLDSPPPPPPKDWQGSPRYLTEIVFQEMLRAGNLHDKTPVPGFRIDYSRLLTFYDRKYASLVPLRRGWGSRLEYRVHGLSEADAQMFREELRGVLARPFEERGSGVAWGELIRHVVEAYTDRLDWLSYLVREIAVDDQGNLSVPGDFNATHVVERVRQRVLTMLSPYITPQDIPSVNDSSISTEWLASAVHRCSSTYTDGLDPEIFSFTPSELLIKSSIEETTREICRTLGVIWTTAYSAESLSESSLLPVLRDWKLEVQRLKSWLGWSVLEKCHPACGEEEFCTVPQWPMDGVNSGWEDVTPHCLPKQGWTMPRTHV